MNEPGFTTCPNCLGVLGSVGCCTFQREPTVNSLSTDYTSFLRRKSAVAPASGIENVPELGDYLFPFQKALVGWALRRGKAALFTAVGTGKTRMEGAFAEQASAYLEAMGEPAEVLILTPLAVAAQTVRELVEKCGMRAKYCKTAEEIDPCAFTVTNYDRLERFDPRRFGVVILDESSIIKHQTSATRDKIIAAFGRTPFRLAGTATPAPNDRKELGNHAEFLGVMTLKEMLSEFFVHDSGKTQQYRLKGHAEAHFWRWIASWGAMLTKPSDLGFSDDGYDLPPLLKFDHVIPGTMEQTIEIVGDKKQLSLLPEPATNLKSQRKARRVTIKDRVAKAVEIIGSEPAEQWIVWCDLNAEADELEAELAKALPGAIEIRGSDTPEAKEAAMLGFASGSIQTLITKPKIAGFGLNWQGCARAMFVGVTHKFEEVHQALGRNHRFGQKRPVHAHFVYSEYEGNVRANLARKEREFQEMAAEMRGIVGQYVRENVCGLARDVAPYDPQIEMTVPEWLT